MRSPLHEAGQSSTSCCVQVFLIGCMQGENPNRASQRSRLDYGFIFVFCKFRKCPISISRKNSWQPTNLAHRDTPVYTLYRISYVQVCLHKSDGTVAKKVSDSSCIQVIGALFQSTCSGPSPKNRLGYYKPT